MITHPAAQGSDGDPAAAATKGPGDQPGKPPAVSPLLLLSLLEGPESALPSSLAGRSEQSQAAGPGGGPQLASAELGARWPCGEISRCQDDKLPWAPRPCRGGGRWRYRSESEAIEIYRCNTNNAVARSAGQAVCPAGHGEPHGGHGQGRGRARSHNPAATGGARVEAAGGSGAAVQWRDRVQPVRGEAGAIVAPSRQSRPAEDAIRDSAASRAWLGWKGWIPSHRRLAS